MNWLLLVTHVYEERAWLGGPNGAATTAAMVVAERSVEAGGDGAFDYGGSNLFRPTADAVSPPPRWSIAALLSLRCSGSIKRGAYAFGPGSKEPQAEANCAQRFLSAVGDPGGIPNSPTPAAAGTKEPKADATTLETLGAWFAQGPFLWQVKIPTEIFRAIENYANFPL